MSASLWQVELGARISFHIIPWSDLAYSSLWSVPEQTHSSTVCTEWHSQAASSLQRSTVLERFCGLWSRMTTRNEVPHPCFLPTSAGLFIQSPLIKHCWKVPAKIISLSHCRAAPVCWCPKASISYLLAQWPVNRRNELCIVLWWPWNSNSLRCYERATEIQETVY